MVHDTYWKADKQVWLLYEGFADTIEHHQKTLFVIFSITIINFEKCRKD